MKNMVKNENVLLAPYSEALWGRGGGGEAVIFLVRKCLSAIQLRPSAPLEGDNEHPWSPALPTTRPVGQLISCIYLLIISSPDCIEEVANGYWCSSLVSWIVSCLSVFANWPTYNPVNREHAWVWFVVQTQFVMLTTLQRHLEGQEKHIIHNTTLH